MLLQNDAIIHTDLKTTQSWHHHHHLSFQKHSHPCNAWSSILTGHHNTFILSLSSFIYLFLSCEVLCMLLVMCASCSARIHLQHLYQLPVRVTVTDIFCSSHKLYSMGHIRICCEREYSECNSPKTFLVNSIHSSHGALAERMKVSTVMFMYHDGENLALKFDKFTRALAAVAIRIIVRIQVSNPQRARKQRRSERTERRLRV